VALDRRAELGQPPTGLGRHHDHRHRAVEGERRLEIAPGLLRERAEVGLGDHGDVGDLGDAGLHVLYRIAGARLDAQHHRVGQRPDVGLRLADADRLDEHPIEQGAHHDDRGEGEGGEPAQPLARRHGAHEHARIVVVQPEAHAIAQERPAAAPRGGIDHDRADRPPGRPLGPDQSREQGRLADPGRPGDADHMAHRGRPGGIEKVESCGRLGGGLEAGEGLGQRPPAAGAQRLERGAQAASAGWPASARRAACAAARRAMGTR
jgi:hypothetical protein